MPQAGDVRYRNRRLVVLYFDLYNMSFFDELRLYDNANTYIASRMTPADMVAIMVFEGGGGPPAAGFHGRQGRAPRGRPGTDDGRRRRAKRPRAGSGRRVWRGRRHVQHLRDGSPVVRAADGGERSRAAAGGEDARLSRQRPAAERRRQSGATARDGECRRAGERHAQPGRRARPRRHGAHGGRDAGVARRRRHVLRHDRASGDDAHAAGAGHAVRARERHRRPRDVRQQRPRARHGAGGARP